MNDLADWLAWLPDAVRMASFAVWAILQWCRIATNASVWEDWSITP